MRSDRLKRREFIALIGGAAAWPVAARAQQRERMRRIGVLTTFAENDAFVQSLQAAFRKRLEEAGWQAGRNIHLDYRWTAGDADRLATFTTELIELKPDLIFTQTTPATAAVLEQNARSRSFLCWSLIQWGAGSSTASTDRAVMSPAS
jgi:putative ABC transport system substrate-binding protein